MSSAQPITATMILAGVANTPLVCNAAVAVKSHHINIIYIDRGALETFSVTRY